MPWRLGEVIGFPVTFPIGSMMVPAHFVFEVLAYAVGFRLYRRLRSRHGDSVDASSRWTVIAAAAAGAAVGSKLLFWFDDPAATWNHRDDIRHLMAGKTIVGGLIGGTMAVELVKAKIGVRSSTGDLFALPLTIAIVIGRIGCFLAGPADDTHGVAFRFGIDFGDGIPRHPSPLYEIVFLVGLAMFLVRRSRSAHKNGELFRTFLLAYMLFRFLADFLKPMGSLPGPTGIQWACIATVVYYRRSVSLLFPHSPTKAPHV